MGANDQDVPDNENDGESESGTNVPRNRLMRWFLGEEPGNTPKTKTTTKRDPLADPETSKSAKTEPRSEIPPLTSSRGSTVVGPLDWYKRRVWWQQALIVFVPLTILFGGVAVTTHDSDLDKCVNQKVTEWESLGRQNSDEVEAGFRELCEAEQEDGSDPGSLNQPYEHQEFAPGSRKIG